MSLSAVRQHKRVHFILFRRKRLIAKRTLNLFNHFGKNPARFHERGPVSLCGFLLAGGLPRAVLVGFGERGRAAFGATRVFVMDIIQRVGGLRILLTQAQTCGFGRVGDALVVCCAERFGFSRLDEVEGLNDVIFAAKL